MIVVTVAFLFVTAPQLLSNIRGMALSALFFVNNDYQNFLSTIILRTIGESKYVCASLVCIPLCAIVNRWISSSKIDEETQLPQNAGVCPSRVLNARFSSRNGSTLLV